MAPRVYVGLASTVHDPAIAIVDEAGEVLFAEATERPLQYKRAWHNLPDEPLRVARLLEAHVPRGAEVVAAESWLARTWQGPAFRASWPLVKRRVPASLRPTVLGQMNSFDVASLELERALVEREADHPPLVRRHYDHHLSHAATACFASGWDDAVCAIVDANGERSSESFFAYRDGRLTPIAPPPRRVGLSWRGSLGAFYAALCVGCGFDPIRGEEWKVMGLAPYGQRDGALYDRLRRLLRVDGLRVTGDGFAMTEALRALRRPGADPMDMADLAHTGQRVFADVMTELLQNLRRKHVSDRLVLGGGCALNSAFNGELLARAGFSALYVFAAPADDGNAIGAAWLACREDQPRLRSRAMLSPYLGSRLDSHALARVESLGGLRPSVTGEAVMTRAADLIADGKIVALAHGRAEYGPRALGHRSILADPRDPTIGDRLNARVKFRERFRPFAPAILEEHGAAYFEDYRESPYMERALRFRPEVRERVPGVVHVDGTGRLQSVKRAWSPRFAALIDRFHARTGVPMVLNTSFNVMGKPIVHAVEDALAVFFTSGVDALVLEDALFEKGTCR